MTACQPTEAPLVRGRVVFFLQGRKVPAARARGDAVARALGQAGIACALRPCAPSVYGDTDLPRPWRDWRPIYYPLALLSRLSQLRDLRADDIVFFQRPMFEWPWIGLERGGGARTQIHLRFRRRHLPESLRPIEVTPARRTGRSRDRR